MIIIKIRFDLKAGIKAILQQAEFVLSVANGLYFGCLILVNLTGLRVILTLGMSNPLEVVASSLSNAANP